MPEPEPRAARRKKIVREPQETPLCHIHDNVRDFINFEESDLDDLRAGVCVPSEDYPLTEFEGKYYCLFHLPTKEKDAEKFEEIFRNRLAATDRACAAIEAEFPDDKAKQDDLKDEKRIHYDFRYVWFPLDVDLSRRKFLTIANFYDATFSGEANFHLAEFLSQAWFSGTTFAAAVIFEGATFSTRAEFYRAVFLAEAFFVWTTFSDCAFFRAAYFSAGVTFLMATFSGDAIFVGTTFLEGADFSSAKFLAEADFKRNKFSKTAETRFDETTFEKNTYFDRARFRNDANFTSTIFGKDSDIFFRQTFFAKKANFQYCTGNGYLRFSNLRQGKESSFDFQEAAYEKASRVSFHNIRLRASWLINCDCRKFVFTACRWKDADGNNVGTKAELKNIENFQHSHKLLTKTCWQLADNHEEMKSFPKASRFRRMANESKRLEENGGWKIWSLHWWYWLSSFYGENPLQAGIILLLIIAVFAVIFWFLPFQVCVGETTPCPMRTLFFGEAVLQSLATASFQSIEYIKPKSTLTMSAVILEKILAPLQAALFALAIRRKFMR